MTKIIGIANSCKDCPERHYFSGGAYECMKVQGSRLNADSTIPTWCPLPNYPTAPVADSAMAKVRLDALEEAAQVCLKKSADYWDAYKRSPIDDVNRANPHVEGMSDGADNCANAIRALAASEPKKD